MSLQPLRFRVWDREERIMYQSPEYGVSVTYPPGSCTPQILVAKQGDTEWRTTVSGPTLLWSGRYDRNGVEVYDGDILDTPFGLGLVYYSYERSCFLINYRDPDVDLPELEALADTMMTTVGNAYRNPELLKELGLPFGGESCDDDEETDLDEDRIDSDPDEE